MGIYLPSVYTRLYPLRSNMHPSKYFRWDISWMNSNGDNWFTFILNYFNLCIFVMFSSWSSKCDPKFLNNWYLSAMVNNVKPFCLVQSLPTVWHYQISKESAGQTCTHKNVNISSLIQSLSDVFGKLQNPLFLKNATVE